MEAPPSPTIPFLSTGQRTRLLVLTAFRTAVAISYLVVVVAQSPFQVAVRAWSSYLLAGLVFALALATAIFVRIGRVPRPLMWIQAGVDIALATAIVAATGRADSPFIFLFLIAVLSAAVLLGKKGGIIGAVVSWGCLATVTLTAPGGVGAARPMDLVVQAVAQVLVAFLGAYFAEELAATSSRLRASREDLSRLSELQQQIVTAVPSGLLTCDVDGVPTYLNPAARAVLGDAPSPDTVRALLAPTSETFGSIPIDVTVRTSTGERVLGVLRAPLGTVADSILIAFQDLTDLRRLEKERVRIESFAALGKVAAQLAHEVRNPLSAMRAAAQMLNDADPAARARLTGLIMVEADRLTGLVEGYLKTARPPPPNPVALHLDRVVGETLEMLRADPEFSRVKAELVPCNAVADAGQVKQVVLNLVRNAARATRPLNGTVRVFTKPESGAATLSVWDSAGAIRPEDIERIFEPFASLSEGGTGLGLSTVRGIVDAHGGLVSLTSNTVDGTLFKVSFPAVR